MMSTANSTQDSLGVKCAKAYLSRQGQPTPELSGKIPDTSTVSNVRTPWQLGRKIPTPAGKMMSGDSNLGANIAR